MAKNILSDGKCGLERLMENLELEDLHDLGITKLKNIARTEGVAGFSKYNSANKRELADLILQTRNTRKRIDEVEDVEMCEGAVGGVENIETFEGAYDEAEDVEMFEGSYDETCEGAVGGVENIETFEGAYDEVEDVEMFEGSYDEMEEVEMFEGSYGEGAVGGVENIETFEGEYDETFEENDVCFHQNLLETEYCLKCNPNLDSYEVWVSDVAVQTEELFTDSCFEDD